MERLNNLIENSNDKLIVHVAEWIKEEAKDGYDNNIKDVLSDLMYGGCASGMVGHLIYNGDCVDFYNEYQEQIGDLLHELLDSTGLSINELFGDKWDQTDPLANSQPNQVLLAWFGFEETANQIAMELDIEL